MFTFSMVVSSGYLIVRLLLTPFCFSARDILLFSHENFELRIIQSVAWVRTGRHTLFEARKHSGRGFLLLGQNQGKKI